MHTYNLTTAKAKFSSIINEVEYKKDKVFITKNGKNVVAIISMEEYMAHFKTPQQAGLIAAKSALSDLDDIEEFEDSLSQVRENTRDRKVNL